MDYSYTEWEVHCTAGTSLNGCKFWREFFINNSYGFFIVQKRESWGRSTISTYPFESYSDARGFLDEYIKTNNLEHVYTVSKDVLSAE